MHKMHEIACYQDPYKNHPFHKGSIDEETQTVIEEQDNSFEDEEERHKLNKI